MNLALFEDAGVQQLLPLTWLRPAFALRCGRTRLIDKLRTHLSPRIARLLLREALQPLVAAQTALEPPEANQPWLLVNARLLLSGDVAAPTPGEAWVEAGELLVAAVAPEDLANWTAAVFQDSARLAEQVRRLRRVPTPSRARLIRYPWELALLNGAALTRELRDGGRHEGRVYPGAHLLNPGAIRIAPGAVIKPGVVLDAEAGPIEIDARAEIQPNAVIEGPCYIGPGCVVRPGAAIRASSTLGPVCKVGGEVEGSIFQGYSNKQHDGFLGHSYVGEWVNLGADTVTSDLKNTYGTIRVQINGVELESGEHFIGSIIGDHAKTGIGTILPTGCVLGVAANVFTRAAVPKFVPSFAWLTDDGLTRFRVDKALQIAATVMQRRGVALDEPLQALLKFVADAAPRVESAGWRGKRT